MIFRMIRKWWPRSRRSISDSRDVRWRRQIRRPKLSECFNDINVINIVWYWTHIFLNDDRCKLNYTPWLPSSTSDDLNHELMTLARSNIWFSGIVSGVKLYMYSKFQLIWSSFEAERHPLLFKIYTLDKSWCLS